MKHLVVGALVVIGAIGGGDSLQKTPHHDFTVAAKRYAFVPDTLQVHQGDLVKVTLVTEDIAHSFVVDEYRIARKVVPGGAVTFEFLADRTGSFTIYCSLTIDDGCRSMKGQLVVLPETLHHPSTR